MFERGALSRDPGTDVAPGGAGAPVGTSAAVPPISAEEATEPLASLMAGGELAGVVEELPARLLVRVQDDDDGDSAEGSDDGVGADGGDLFAGEPGGDAALMAPAEGREVVGVEESAAAGLLGLGAAGLEELAAACHRPAAWATWGESLAAACLTGCGELSAHPDQWGRAARSRRWWAMRSAGSTPPACSRPAWGSRGLGPGGSWTTAAR